MTDIPDEVVERASEAFDSFELNTSHPDIKGRWRAAGRIFVEWEREQIKRQIDARLNSHLLDMQPNHDDAITGFNEAWDKIRDVIRARSEQI